MMFNIALYMSYILTVYNMYAGLVYLYIYLLFMYKHMLFDSLLYVRCI